MNSGKKPNRRSDNRLDICLPIEVTLETGEVLRLCSRNMSTTGIFLEKGEHALPPKGSVIRLKIGQQLGMGDNPVVKGRIARETDEGIGVCFLSDD